MADGLDIQITYRAILDAAREKGFITYSDLAERHGAKIRNVRSVLIAQLNDLLKICYRKGFPAMSVIVVGDRQEELTGGYLRGFANGAKVAGWDVRNAVAFAYLHKKKLIEWAPHAPRILETEEPSDESSDDSASRDEPNYWVVGAYHGSEDQERRFLEEGIWENGDDGKCEKDVRKVKVGDYLIMKSIFTQSNDLPFDNNNDPISAMRIKATGIVTGLTIDGRKLEVKWKPLSNHKNWYFFTYRGRIQRMNVNKKEARELINFAFDDEDQDFDYWLSRDWIKSKGYKSISADSQSTSIQEDESRVNQKSNKNPYGISDIIRDGCFFLEEDISNFIVQLKSKKNLILQGPPGTGKTWLARRLANALIGTDSEDFVRSRVRRIQFHPSLSYEDFVRGWRPSLGGNLDLVDGTFLNAVKAARSNLDSDYVIIIDEINRGNTAQIFGEMLTLIESDKRNESEAIEIAYPRHDRERIHVPENLHIIGTMNIADRSLALVDLALRRRFAFVSLEPVLDARWVEWCVGNSNFNRELVSEVGNALKSLNDQITNDRSLGLQYRIGHSYVTPSADEVVEDGREWFRQAIVFGIAPLLHEYWFENPDVATEYVNKLLESVQ